ncbi:uncharacterized protein BXZ73DRAFT_102943 [Epithele typhae]|uniref:uncharacterized protein n=1 Tax=Epithele typhae TaxID=378194 RepID=UPI002007F6E4|nr:uncharacterized protein BXZ73DRAFT_102943 [Epithele typhae]KAH9926260.1 hypothetical protein BXZ73DRAFT_102943 [Epithele typhae]
MYATHVPSFPDTHEVLLVPREGDDAALRARVISALVGILLHGILYGCVLFSVRLYWKEAPSTDRPWLKFLILLCTALLSINLPILLHVSYNQVQHNFNDLGLTTPWDINLSPIFNTTAIIIIRFLLLRRLWKFCQTFRAGPKRIVSLLGLFLSLLTTLAAYFVNIASMISSHVNPTDIALNVTLSYTSFANGFVADLLFAGMLCAWLHSSRTGIKSTDSAITILIVYTIESAMTPLLCDTAAIIALKLAPQLDVHVFFWLQMGPLYFLSLLVSLNSRQDVSKRIRDPTVSRSAGGQLPTYNIQFASPDTFELSSLNGRHGEPEKADLAAAQDHHPAHLVGARASTRDVAAMEVAEVPVDRHGSSGDSSRHASTLCDRVESA